MIARADREAALLDRARKKPETLSFEELRQLAQTFGFVFVRARGSHFHYKRLEPPPCYLTIQPRKGDKKMAKPYQVGQLVDFIEENLLEED